MSIIEEGQVLTIEELHGFGLTAETHHSEDPQAKAEGEKDRELEFLRGKVAAYETALRLLAGERGIESPLSVVK